MPVGFGVTFEAKLRFGTVYAMVVFYVCLAYTYILVALSLKDLGQPEEDSLAYSAHSHACRGAENAPYALPGRIWTYLPEALYTPLLLSNLILMCQPDAL